MKRKIYETLLSWKNNNIDTPLMVIGVRQIGKTYIINEFCKNEFEDYIYINPKYLYYSNEILINFIDIHFHKQ